VEWIGTAIMNGIFWIAYGIIIITLLIIYAPFWVLDKFLSLFFGPDYAEPIESSVVVPDNCFVWNE